MLVSSGELRKRLVTYLAFLSSKECLQLVGEHVGSERLAFELCRIWFDAIYLPSRRYINGLKGDFSPVQAEVFEACFDEGERALLERFHRFFELRVDMLPEKYRAEGRFPDVDLWRNIVRDAGYLLEDLDGEAPSRQSRLREHLEAVATGRASAASLRKLLAAD